MVIVCQQCGDLGYAELLIYCSLCHKAARHQYCLNIIPELDEHIVWSCDDCSFTTRKVECVNGQYLEPSEDICLSSKENIISYENKGANDMHVAYNSKNKANLHVHKQEMKTCGNTNKRSTRTMQLTSEVCNGSLIDEVTIFQPMKCLKPNNRRRKLILPVEGDDESLDGVWKGSSVEREINVSRTMIPLHQSSMKDKHNDNMKKSTMIDKENVDNNIEHKSLKETKASKDNETKVLGVKSVLQNTKIDDEMATKAKSKDDLLESSYDLPLFVHLQYSPRSQSELNDVLAMPIVWRGWFKICGRDYGPLVAHLSPKIGEKAWKAAGSLPQVIQLTMVSSSYGWPRFKISPPTDDHIALIFLPSDSRVEEKVDQLVQEVIRCDLMLKVALDEAELLVFPSNLLPENYKRYHDKHYLWGAFKGKDSDSTTGEIRLAQTYESAKQTVPNSSIKSQEAQTEMVDEDMSLDGDEPHLTDEGGKKTVPNLLIEYGKVQIKKSMEGDEPQESLSPLADEGEDVGMGNDLRTDEGLIGCLELFPTQVENIALRLKMGDRKESVDLELSLGLPFRQLRTLPLD